MKEDRDKLKTLSKKREGINEEKISDAGKKERKKER